MKMSPWVLVFVGFAFGSAAGLTYGDRAQKKMLVSTVAMAEQSAEKFKELGALHKGAVEKWQACSARWNDAASTGTVIYDPRAMEPVGGGIVGIMQQIVNGKLLTRQEKESVRWIIPFKVEPQVADAIRGARYGWIDKDGKFQGWFTPKKVD
jgi:hypothetical protein